jgi:hypothetical protein
MRYTVPPLFFSKRASGGVDDEGLGRKRVEQCIKGSIALRGALQRVLLRVW